MTFHQSLDSFDFHPELPFVVHRAARINVVVALRRFKRRRNPFIERIRRLHIVVRITQGCRFTRRFNPVGVDERMTFSRNDFDMLQADSPHLGSHKFCSLLHIGLVLSQSTDTGDAKQILQLGQKSLLITAGIIHCRGSHKLRSLSRKRTRSVYPSLKRLSIPGLMRNAVAELLGRAALLALPTAPCSEPALAAEVQKPGR